MLCKTGAKKCSLDRGHGRKALATLENLYASLKNAIYEGRVTVKNLLQKRLKNVSRSSTQHDLTQRVRAQDRFITVLESFFVPLRYLIQHVLHGLHTGLKYIRGGGFLLPTFVLRNGPQSVDRGGAGSGVF